MKLRRQRTRQTKGTDPKALRKRVPVRRQAGGSVPREAADAEAVLGRSRRLGHSPDRLLPGGGRRRSFLQRMSINLQPDDRVIPSLVTYVNETLGVGEEVVTVGTGEPRTVGSSENVYLYGHGGASDLLVEDFDMFARMNVATVAGAVVSLVTFPEDYTGTIYLIGCKTRSLVTGVKAQLMERTGLDLDVRGTPEKLQTAGEGDIVVRRPQSEDDARRLESVDMQRRYYARLIALRSKLFNTQRTLVQAGNYGERRQGIIGVIETIQALDELHDELTNGLGRLGTGTLSPTLGGRREGLQAVLDSIASVQEARSDLRELSQQWVRLDKETVAFNSTQERNIAGRLALLLKQAREPLKEEISATALFIQIMDQPDVNISELFTLEQMEGEGGGEVEEESSGVSWGTIIGAGIVTGLFLGGLAYWYYKKQ